MNRKKGNSIKIKTILVFLAVSLGVSAFLCACGNKKSGDDTPVRTDEPGTFVTATSGPVDSPVIQPSRNPSQVIPEPIIFEEKLLEVNGRQNHVFLLTVDISDPGVTVMPYLAFNRIFGFDYLRSMVDATNAIAAVNAGFFFEYGRPSGLVVNNGKIISGGTGKFYSIVIENGTAGFEIIKTTIQLHINGTVIDLDSFNMSPGESRTAVFSDEYGSTDRLGYYRTVMIINDGKVTGYWKAESTVEIPDGGFVVMLPPDHTFDESPLGAEAEIIFNPSFGENTMAYECASMLVQDGQSLAGDSMPWVGNLNHYDPRTCVGVMRDGKLGFVVIDGRQKDYSSGTTGRETADILIDLGFTDAVMLDGGGSSQMIFDGNTVNSPSSGPDGRPIAGGFMIIN